MQSENLPEEQLGNLGSHEPSGDGKEIGKFG